MVELIVGKKYLVTHQRKGTFVAKLESDDGETVDLEIVAGHAIYKSNANADRGFKGDVITVRKDFYVFAEIEGGE